MALTGIAPHPKLCFRTLGTKRAGRGHRRRFSWACKPQGIDGGRGIRRILDSAQPRMRNGID